MKGHVFRRIKAKEVIQIPIQLAKLVDVFGREFPVCFPQLRNPALEFLVFFYPKAHFEGLFHFFD